MKSLLCLVGLVALLSISQAEDKWEAKPRFKGVELYSWKDKAGDWVFVLLAGTNESKTEASIKGAMNQIKGVDDLKKALALLAVGEYVSWSCPKTGFEFPSEVTQKDVAKAAKDAKITLAIDGVQQ